MDTPDIEAMKCWSGNLGKCATHAVVYAQLYTPDGICHGLHAFVVPIREPQTLHTYPGITVGDMGKKIGQNGVANGSVMFIIRLYGFVYITIWLVISQVDNFHGFYQELM